MRALILYVPGSTGGNDPGDDGPRDAANMCASMGIKPVFFPGIKTGTTGWDAADLDKVIAACGIDLVINPTNTTAGTDGRYAALNISAGQLANNIPVFLLSVNHSSSTYISGVEVTQIGAAGDYVKATIASTGGTIYTAGKRWTLKTATGSEVITPLVYDEATPANVSAFKYSPDGTTWVYADGINLSGVNLLHLLVQEAINDGVLAKPPKKSPVFLNIDHLNSPGDTYTDGTDPDDTMGSIRQPEIIATMGEMLRQGNGVCYASIEQGFAPLHTAALTANFAEYSDVFKYIACHDHNVGAASDLVDGTYLNGGAGAAGVALSSQETKAAIAASYASTAAIITGLGLTVNADLAHFAGDAVGPNFFELAQSATMLTADPTDTTAQAGYGFKMARIATTYNQGTAYPVTSKNDHWLRAKTKFRGIVCLRGVDTGPENGAAVALNLDFRAWQYNVFATNSSRMMYQHIPEFEVAANNPTGLISDGTAFARGYLTWQTGIDYQAACPDVYNWGADINDYIA